MIESRLLVSQPLVQMEVMSVKDFWGKGRLVAGSVWGRRWVVPVAALVLVLAVGATAWAATTGTTEQGKGDADERPGVFAFGHGLGRMGGIGPMGDIDHMGGMFMFGGDERDLRQRREHMQSRQKAILNLFREKMSADDQKKLDDLMSQAEEQKKALDKALEDLQSTTQELRNLVQKYWDQLPGSDAGSGTTETTGSTSPS